jgi:ArsR family transcriptional regulator
MCGRSKAMAQCRASRRKALGTPSMPLSPESFTRSLADATRLRILMLLHENDELCVCELTEALALPQPKISRHLAVLRETGMLLDRRAGLWIHYRRHPDLPAWALDALSAIARGCKGTHPFGEDRLRLSRLALSPAATCG